MLKRTGPTQEFRLGGDGIDFTINIETSEPPRGIPPSFILRERPTMTQLLGIRSERPRRSGLELSDDELQSRGFHGSHMQLRADRDAEVTEKSYHSDKEYFTIHEVIANIVDFETARRQKTDWFGGINAHHVYSEGMFPNDDGESFNIWWAN